MSDHTKTPADSIFYIKSKLFLFRFDFKSKRAQDCSLKIENSADSILKIE